MISSGDAIVSIVSEFKTFVLRGNVVELAVGVIIGAAFGKVVSSLVADILMPPIGWALGGVDLTTLTLDLPGTMRDPNNDARMVPVKLRYGAFLQAVLDFLVIAACLFAVVKAMNALKRKQEEAPPAPTATEKLLAEIRDLLKR